MIIFASLEFLALVAFLVLYRTMKPQKVWGLVVFLTKWNHKKILLYQSMHESYSQLTGSQYAQLLKEIRIVSYTYQRNYLSHFVQFLAMLHPSSYKLYTPFKESKRPGMDTFAVCIWLLVCDIYQAQRPTKFQFAICLFAKSFLLHAEKLFWGCQWYGRPASTTAHGHQSWKRWQQLWCWHSQGPARIHLRWVIREDYLPSNCFFLIRVLMNALYTDTLLVQIIYF